MENDDPAWVTKGGFSGQLKKLAIIALISITALLLPLYRFFIGIRKKGKR